MQLVVFGSVFKAKQLFTLDMLVFFSTFVWLCQFSHYFVKIIWGIGVSICRHTLVVSIQANYEQNPAAQMYLSPNLGNNKLSALFRTIAQPLFVPLLNSYLIYETGQGLDLLLRLKRWKSNKKFNYHIIINSESQLGLTWLWN